MNGDKVALNANESPLNVLLASDISFRLHDYKNAIESQNSKLISMLLAFICFSHRFFENMGSNVP